MHSGGEESDSATHVCELTVWLGVKWADLIEALDQSYPGVQSHR